MYSWKMPVWILGAPVNTYWKQQVVHFLRNGLGVPAQGNIYSSERVESPGSGTGQGQGQGQGRTD